MINGYSIFGNHFCVLDSLLDQRANLAFCEQHAIDGFMHVQLIDQGCIHAKLFNQDGSVINMSGNGSLILFFHLLSLQLVDKNQTYSIINNNADPVYISANQTHLEFSMKVTRKTDPSDQLSGIDFVKVFQNAALSCHYFYPANRQVVVFSPPFSQLSILSICAKEIQALFKDSCNVAFVYPKSRTEADAIFIERGVGHTSSSLTGSIASAAAMHLYASDSDAISISNEQGSYLIRFADDTAALTLPRNEVQLESYCDNDGIALMNSIKVTESKVCG